MSKKITAATAQKTQSAVETIRDNIKTVIRGQDEVVEQLLTALLAGGHVLLEGVPGVAKTLLAVCVARSFNMQFMRVQFTPDLMPADITGVSIFRPQNGRFQFQPGPVFTDLFLADEINRAPAKTQSALLEAMQEGQTTVDGTTRPLSDVFTVLATQNPVEMDGTYPLPEAQVDRFLLKINMDYPAREDEFSMLKHMYDSGAQLRSPEGTIKKAVTKDGLLKIRSQVFGVTVDESVLRYVHELILATRELPILTMGASPRAGVMLMQAVRARALCQGRDHAVPDDVQAVAAPVLRHRLILKPEAEIENITPDECVETLLKQVAIPR